MYEPINLHQYEMILQQPQPRGPAEVLEGAEEPAGPLPGGGHPQPHPRHDRQDERHHLTGK